MSVEADKKVRRNKKKKKNQSPIYRKKFHLFIYFFCNDLRNRKKKKIGKTAGKIELK